MIIFHINVAVRKNCPFPSSDSMLKIIIGVLSENSQEWSFSPYNPSFHPTCLTQFFFFALNLHLENPCNRVIKENFYNLLITPETRSTPRNFSCLRTNSQWHLQRRYSRYLLHTKDGSIVIKAPGTFKKNQ